MGLTATPEELEQLLVAAVPEKKAEAAAPKLEQEVVVNKYCTEFIILGSGIDPHQVRGELESKGDSLLVVSDGDVVKVHTLRRGAAEAIEAVAHGDARNSKVVGKRIEEIKMPAGTTIGAIVRQEQVIIVHHDTVIEAEDHLILFIVDKKKTREVEKLFQVGLGFL